MDITSHYFQDAVDAAVNATRALAEVKASHRAMADFISEGRTASEEADAHREFFKSFAQTMERRGLSDDLC